MFTLDELDSPNRFDGHAGVLLGFSFRRVLNFEGSFLSVVSSNLSATLSECFCRLIAF